MMKICEYCGKEYEPNPCHRCRQKFCSRLCHGKYMSKVLFDRSGSVSGWAGDGKVKVCGQCGENYEANKHRQKFCGLECSGKARLGENCNFWKGGVSSKNERIRRSPEFRQWSYKVKERDGFRCQICGSTIVRFESHHILCFSLYPKLRFVVDNGVCLCVSCHQRLEWGLRREDVLFVKLNIFLGWRIYHRKLLTVA